MHMWNTIQKMYLKGASKTPRCSDKISKCSPVSLLHIVMNEHMVVIVVKKNGRREDFGSSENRSRATMREIFSFRLFYEVGFPRRKTLNVHWELLQALTVANKTNDRAACYHLGQYFEAQGNQHAAVDYFTKARACSNALRLAKVTIIVYYNFSIHYS